MTKKFLAAAAIGGLLASVSTGALAQTSTRSQAPGAEMHENGSVRGTNGASGYAPGQQMQEKGSLKGTNGASGYASGHATNGSSANSNTNVRPGGMNPAQGINAGADVRGH
jgi:hypothetical protein